MCWTCEPRLFGPVAYSQNGGVPRPAAPSLTVGEWRHHRLRDGKGRPTGVARLRDVPRQIRPGTVARLKAALSRVEVPQIVTDLEVELVAGPGAVTPYDFTDLWVRAAPDGTRDERWSGWTGPGVSACVWEDERGIEHWLGAAVSADEGEPWFAHLGPLAVGR